MIYFCCEGDADYQIYKGIDDTKTGGQLGVIVDGVIYTGDTLNAANAYTGLVTAKSGSYQMTLDGALVNDPNGNPAEGTLKPWPTDGVIKLGFIGDSQSLSATQSGFAELLANEDDIDVWYGSEMHYLETGVGGVLYGDAETPTPWTGNSLSTAVNQALYLNYLNGDLTNPGFASKTWALSQYHVDRQAFFAANRFMGLVDNHEFGNSVGAGLTSGVHDQPGLVTYDAMRFAAYQFSYLGWPSATGNVDSEPLPLMYGSKEYGNLLVIWADQHSYDFNGGKNLHSGTVGEIKQPVWIGEQIANTSCEFILIIFQSPPQAGMGSWVNAGNTITDYINDSPKTIFSSVADMHVLYERMIHEDLPDRPMWEIGVSPCGPTDGTAAIEPFDGDEYGVNGLSYGTTLIAEYDPNAVPPANVTLQVADTSMMSNSQADGKQRIWFKGALSQAGLIQSIDGPQQVTLVNPTTSNGIIPVNNEVWFHKVHGVAHANAGGPGIACYYTKMTINNDKPIRVEVYETYGKRRVVDKLLRNFSRYPVNNTRASPAGFS